MANYARRVPENVSGDFFVDETCIDCDTCRQLAPDVIGEASKYAYVASQPNGPRSRRSALYALVSCPTGSIGCRGGDRPQTVMDDFPLVVEAPVHYCGFNSAKSYGGNSYFIRHADGNWLVDSPKFQSRLVRNIESMGGIKHIFLTHSDDVADARLFADHFGSERIIHRLELHSQPDAENVIDGIDPVRFGQEFIAIPTPGHTAGHCVLLFGSRFLFTGDHLAYDRHARQLEAFRDYCWDSWRRQVDSMRILAEFDFEWVLPGHGQRISLTSGEMRRHMRALVARMENESL